MKYHLVNHYESRWHRMKMYAIIIWSTVSGNNWQAYIMIKIHVNLTLDKQLDSNPVSYVWHPNDMLKRVYIGYEAVSDLLTSTHRKTVSGQLTIKPTSWSLNVEVNVFDKKYVLHTVMTIRHHVAKTAGEKRACAKNMLTMGPAHVCISRFPRDLRTLTLKGSKWIIFEGVTGYPPTRHRNTNPNTLSWRVTNACST
jgi:hypothetical protein